MLPYVLSDQEYQTLDHPVNNKNLSSIKVIINLIKSVIGVGVLNISYAVIESGIPFYGILILLSIITWHNANILGNMIQNYQYYSEELITYPFIIKKIYGNTFEKIVYIIWVTEIYMVSLILLNLSTDFLSEITNLERNYILLISTGCFLIVGFVKDYSRIYFISALGLIVLFGLVICLCMQITVPMHIHYSEINYKNIPKSLGIALFSFGGHVIFPETMDSIANKDKLKKTIGIAWVIITLFTMLFSLLGIFAYGHNVNDNIADNLPKGTIKTILMICIFINIVFTYPLISNPLLLNLKIPHLHDYSLRTLFILSLGTVCYFWPSFISMISITGMILENLTSIIFPPLLVLPFSNHLGEKIINIGIIIFGIIIMISGIYFSLQ
jgi:amino acid permease